MCSPNVISNQGTVEFTCNAAIDKATAIKIVSLLNQILRKQGSPDSANQKLDEILDFLRSHERSPYDTTVMYSFDGMKQRIISDGGAMQVANFGGPTAGIFKQMSKLEDDQDWPGLLAICGKTMGEIPAWATPYLFCSKANSRLHNLDVATKQLEQAKGIVHESPEYAPAIDNVSRLLEQERPKQ